MGWSMEVVDVTGSTNADLAEAARRGDRGPRVRAARSQTAGRGRLGRSWVSAPGASLAMSVLWAPTAPQAAWTWLPAVVGLGVLDAVAELGGEVGTDPGAASLKWPNDVVVAEGPPPTSDAHPGPDGARTGLAKLAGILSEVVAGPAGAVVVLGAGVNLADPDPAAAGGAATSLARVLARDVSVEQVLPVLAGAVQARLETWGALAGDPDASGVAADYRAACTTLGRWVVVSTPGGTRAGTVVDVDRDASLVVDQEGTGRLVRISAGDVEHVR